MSNLETPSVLEFPNLASFPVSGESDKIYIAADTNLTYRWATSNYTLLNPGITLGETPSTAYRGDRGKTAYDHSQIVGNPHGTTKADVGLSNVDNTSDLNKPVSTAQESALNSYKESAKANQVGYYTVMIQSPNIYDFETARLVNGFLSNSSGAVSTSSPNTYHPSPFIPWDANSMVSVGLQGAVPTEGCYSVLQYDAAFAPITASWSGTAANLKTFTKYAGAVYFRATLREGRQDQLNYGSAVLPYNAYFPTINNKIGTKDGLGNEVTFNPNINSAAFEAFMANYLNVAYLNKSILQNADVWSEYTFIKVKKDGTGDFTNLMTALASITTASASNRFIVQLYDDIYGYQKTDFVLPSGLSFYVLAHVRSFIKLMGMNGVRTIYGELPANLLLADYENTETVHLDGFGELENIRVVAKNIRYALHYERSNGIINQNAIFKASRWEAIHLGSEEVPLAQRWTATDAVGTGITTGVQYDFDGVRIIGARYGLRIHSNTLDQMPNKFVLKNSTFASMLSDGVAINIDNSPTSRESRFVELNNCAIEGKFYVNILASSGMSGVNKIVPSIKINGGGNAPFFFQNDQTFGQVLRITSNTTGSTSIVKLVTDDAGLLGNLTIGKGSLGLKCFLYGDNELIQSGIANRKNIIGHRLGNCVTANKNLVLNIDGINRTVVFNLNYSDGNYAVAPLIDANTILNSINSQLAGYAVADYFSVNLEYYHECTDVLFYKGNISPISFIPKSSFVKFVGYNQCRLATIGEIPDGMAIDDLPVLSTIQTLGRVIKNCKVIGTGRFAPLFNGSFSFAVGDCFKLDASGRLEKDTAVKDSFAIALSSSLIYIK
ncbi:hypothetical protein SAMN04487898_11678 [Pedobacter sp. ok626]|uniref:hypothetical protein n=1 Tax=Pedobacter sp. ok626 TaxID=1761882 RepID=UPI0008848E77|nr:hypothetical protein [Pedobacter sp. ok626]SDL22805.1 hypothetical protein SAMN04487898_11678 [Pedobacter sp. ok626]